jgi:hypothetical protein
MLYHPDDLPCTPQGLQQPEQQYAEGAVNFIRCGLPGLPTVGVAGIQPCSPVGVGALIWMQMLR